MPRICTTISEKTEDNLKNIMAKTNKSFSRIVSDIIEIGLVSYKNRLVIESQKQQKNSTESELKHSEYLLRILNINSEILRKLYDEPSKCVGKTADLILGEIKTHVKKHLDELKNKP